jgi:hypothetical protein
MDHFKLIAAQAPDFIGDLNTCVVESVHRHVLNWANKMLSYPATYYGRVMFSALVWNQGWSWSICRLFDLLGVPVSQTLQRFLCKKDEERAANALRMASAEYRRRYNMMALQRDAVRELASSNVYGYNFLDDFSRTIAAWRNVDSYKASTAPPVKAVAATSKKLEKKEEKKEQSGEDTEVQVSSPPRKKPKTQKQKRESNETENRRKRTMKKRK